VIDGSKKRTEQITKELDGIKEKNEKLKASGSGALEGSREKLREMKKQIVGVIEERKAVSSQIDTIREKQKGDQEAIKKQKASVGRFTTNDAIDEEIRRIEDHMAHNTMNLKAEKAFMIEIKELNKKRDEVKALEQMEGKRGSDGGKARSLPELFDARKEVDAKLDVLRTQEKAAVEQMNAIRDKTQDRSSSERFEKLLEERKVVRDKIGEKIGEIRVLRNEFQAVDDTWYEHDRLAKNLKWQLRQVKQKKYEEDQKKWEEEKATRGEEWAAEQERRKTLDEDGNPREIFMDFDLAERISHCEQLVDFLLPYTPEGRPAVAVEVKVNLDGRKVEKPTDVSAFSKGSGKLADDELGLNAFFVDEVVSKKSKKKGKKKQANAEKWDTRVMVEQGEVVPITLSFSMMQQFAGMNIAVPVDSNDAVAAVGALQTKKDYYAAKGAEGLKLKDIIKAEKDAKKPAKKEVAKEEKPAKAKSPAKEEVKKAADPADAAFEAAQDEEESEDEELAADEVADKEETKKDVDWNADKIARKLAAMPEVDKDLDIAAMRAKAQGNKMSDEEKKARGLLYDTSKAKATRESSEEEEEGACDAVEGAFDDY